MSQEFVVLKLSAGGNLVLKGEGDAKPIAHPTNAYLAGKPVATVFETIGRESSPLFLASPARGVDAAGLVGKTISTAH
ncbi:MAG: hypothetical protein WC792_01110 [Candidatus Micrarchaeia archaeon]